MPPRTSLDRRRFLGDSATLLGSTALATLLGQAPAAMTYSFLAQEAAAGLKGERAPWLVAMTIVLSVLSLLLLSWWVRGILLGRDKTRGDSGGDTPPQS